MNAAALYVDKRLLEHRIAWLKARIAWFGGEDEPWYRKWKAEQKLAGFERDVASIAKQLKSEPLKHKEIENAIR